MESLPTRYTEMDASSQVWWRAAMEKFEGNTKFVLYSLRDTQPTETDHSVGDVVGESEVEDQLSCRVQDWLKLPR